MRHFAIPLLAAAAACGGTPTDPGVPPGATLALAPQNLRALDPATEGRYELWLVDAAGVRHSAGAFTPGVTSSLSVPASAGAPTAVELSVEPPGDADPAQ